MTPTHNVFFSISNPFEAKSPVRLNPSKLKPPNPSQPITTHHPTHHLFIISTWNKITPYMLSFFLFVEQNSKRWWVWWVFLKKHKVRTINFLAKTAKNLQPQFYTNLKSTHHPSPITSHFLLDLTKCENFHDQKWSLYQQKFTITVSDTAVRQLVPGYLFCSIPSEHDNTSSHFSTNSKSTHHPSPITSQYHCTFLFNIKIYIATNGLNLHNHYHYQWYYHQTNRSF